MPESEISRINSQPGKAVPVSRECLDVIRQTLEFTRLTGGAFDITKRNVPVVISYVNSSVLVDEGTELDLGGVVKGYAVDRITQVLQAGAVKRAMVNFGGNIFLIGCPPEKEYWTIGIKNPRQARQLIGALKLPGGTAVATSADYERPGHIIDPRTGQKADKSLSVTVVAPEAMTADALSTGIFVLGPGKGMELVESLTDVEAVIVDDAGIKVSSGLKENFTKK